MASTSGRPSTRGRRRGSSSAGDLVARTAIGALAQDIIGTLEMELERALNKKGSSLVEALAAVKPADKEESDSLLHMAAGWGRLEVCKYLIKDLHLDVDAAGDDGATPMISTIEGIDPTSDSHKKKEAMKIVDLLIRRGADPNKSKTDGFTAIHAATSKDSCEITKLLLVNGAEVNAICHKGTVLHIAAESAISGALMKLLLEHGANAHTVNMSGYTPLHLAVIKDSCEITKLLLVNGAEVNAICHKGTVLHIAAESAISGALMKLLLEHGANAHTVNMSGYTPLHLAVIKGAYEIALILLSKQVEVDPICEKGTPLHLAAERGNLEMLALLLDNGADANIADTVGRRAIDLAGIKGSRECVETLFPWTLPTDECEDWSVEAIIQQNRHED